MDAKTPEEKRDMRRREAERRAPKIREYRRVKNAEMTATGGHRKEYRKWYLARLPEDVRPIQRMIWKFKDRMLGHGSPQVQRTARADV